MSECWTVSTWKKLIKMCVFRIVAEYVSGEARLRLEEASAEITDRS
ncbi:MAG: hypothetical protein QXU43_07800 [Thermoproteota archaeon]